MEREAEAAKEELAVGGWQPFEEIINSTTTKSTTTITTVGTTGESSFGSFALKKGDANFDDSKTSPEHVILDFTTTTASAIQGGAKINPEQGGAEINPEHVLLDFTAATTSAIQGGAVINTEEEDHFKTDLYLETVCTKPENYNFYCPNCKACIEKVLIRNEEEMRCPTCLECVKFIGGWVLQKFSRRKPEDLEEDDSLKQKSPITSPVSPPPPPPAAQLPPPISPIKWEILKSVVYGGLIESITSLSIVTSASSSATATLNIVALALANLIGGLFVIGHNLRELKNEQSRVDLNQEGEQVDRYKKILGQKKNFILHASVAVLSFLVFGLVPPLVYGFSFYESDNEYLKLAAVAAASVLCITLLAIAKASIQNPPVSKYITTVLHYLAIGVAASGISYLVGYLVEKLIEKLGLFESTVTLPIPEMSLFKHAWGSY
ncbi:membrane protein of ER body 2-like isoform X2 [Corylus avellana]|uniref:membrane protein of ER body 2-like isoform X2 n=1 Tax=Corylus avellana TaxID=13451 RepID=UPI00286A6EB9|nr:membrane protein of ER body 2-like isoform X2 [Corylus avellana]